MDQLACDLSLIKMLLLQDAEMMEQIDRDVMRTHPDMHFFSGSDGAAVTHREVPEPCSPLFSSSYTDFICLS